jgi:hypothetical protein
MPPSSRLGVLPKRIPKSLITYFLGANLHIPHHELTATGPRPVLWGKLSSVCRSVIARLHFTEDQDK